MQKQFSETARNSIDMPGFVYRDIGGSPMLLNQL